MSVSCVVVLLNDQRYIQRLANILATFTGQRKLAYVLWLKSIGLEVKYQ